MTEDKDPRNEPAQAVDWTKLWDALEQWQRKFRIMSKAVVEKELGVDALNGLLNSGQFLFSGNGALLIFSIVAKKALERDDLSEDQKRSLQDEADKLGAWFLDVNNSDMPDKEAALSGVRSAQLIARSAGFNEDKRREIWADAVAVEKRARVDPAIKARKAEAIDDLIKRLSKKLWERKPSFKGNYTWTAKEILSAFSEELSTLPKRPNGWPVNDLENPTVKKRPSIESDGRLPSSIPDETESCQSGQSSLVRPNAGQSSLVQ